MPSPAQSLWIPLHSILALAVVFRMRDWAKCAVAYNMQIACEHQSSCPDEEELPGLTTSKKWSRWLSVGDGELYEGLCLNVNGCNLIFKLLKEEKQAERETTGKKGRSVLQREMPWGGFVSNRSKYCGLIGSDIFHWELTSQKLRSASLLLSDFFFTFLQAEKCKVTEMLALNLISWEVF